MGMSVVARQSSPDRISLSIANMKRCTFVLLALLSVAVSVMAAPQDKKSDIGVKAPSPYENCNCQCHHYTWQDTYGKIQGNCKSLDGTRGRWCYVEGFACDDIQYSKSRRDQYGQLRKWSYQTCSTPAPGTGRCAYGGGYGNGFNSGYNNGCNERHGNCNRPVYNNNNNNNYRPNRPNRPGNNLGGLLGGILGGILNGGGNRPFNQPRVGDKSSSSSSSSTKGGVNFGQ